MAQIVINEISQNYTFNIGTNSYATVAMPLTSCWGPGYFDPSAEYPDETSPSDARQRMLEQTVWQRFPATQAGLESFVATYRGPVANYRMAKDFSYQMAVTLLSAGYDILACRISPGSHATGKLVQVVDPSDLSKNATINFRAKYPGTFGNNIQVVIKKIAYIDPAESDTSKRTKYCWNLITYVVDPSGVKSSVESKTLVFNSYNATDSILYYKEVESDFWEIVSIENKVKEDADAATPMYNNKAYVRFGDEGLVKGTDYDTSHTAAELATGTDTLPSIGDLAKTRYDWAKSYSQSSTSEYGYYISAINKFIVDPTSETGYISDDLMQVLYAREWIFTHAVGNATDIDLYNQEVGSVYDLLKDKLTYNPNRVISPGWDDQDVYMYTDDTDAIFGEQSGTDPAPYPPLSDTCVVPISPLHLKLMDVAYYSRCATGFIDTPHIVDRRYVHIEDESDLNKQGYIQKLARLVPKNAELDANGTLFHTHSAFFAPWAQYTYVGTNKMNVASPSFIALMIQRAQILNQSIQYEWALPTNRKHNLRIGTLDYTVPKKVLDKWQKLEGVSVNILTAIPDLGTNIWGNSTLYEVPPATYQALANLSTRYLVNAVEDVAYRCGLDITFQYNNQQAYNKFYAGVIPTLDTMRNVGAIDDYRVEMSADINGLDHVNANTVIGKIWLVVNGVINDIFIDLIALPAGLGIDLNSLS